MLGGSATRGTYSSTSLMDLRAEDGWLSFSYHLLFLFGMTWNLQADKYKGMCWLSGQPMSTRLSGSPLVTTHACPTQGREEGTAFTASFLQAFGTQKSTTRTLPLDHCCQVLPDPRPFRNAGLARDSLAVCMLLESRKFPLPQTLGTVPTAEAEYSG